MVYLDHGDRRHLVWHDLEMAASASGISLEQAASNIEASVIHQLGVEEGPAVEEILKPLTLLFDIDGVLGFLTETIVTGLNAHFGTSLVVSEMTDYWLEEVLPPDQSKWLVEQFQRPVVYANVAPDYAGIAAVQAIWRARDRLLARPITIVVSSDRPPDAQQVTKDWLRKWRVPYDQLVLRGKGGKLSIAREHDPEHPLILLDDDPRKMETVATLPGCRVWTPLRPWTPRRTPPAGSRVFDAWADVLEWLDIPDDIPVPQFSTEAGPAQQSNSS